MMFPSRINNDFLFYYKKNPDPLLSQDFLFIHFNNDLLKSG